MNRRDTFRAAVHQFRGAVLQHGRGDWKSRIVDESAGGLCVSMNGEVQLSPGTEAQLKTDDGDVVAVRIVYCTILGQTTLIGLQRLEGAVCPPRSRRAVSPLIFLLGITTGLWAGYLIQASSVARWLPHF